MSEEFGRMQCGTCGKDIRFPLSRAGTVAKCPDCSEPLRLVDAATRPAATEGPLSPTPGPPASLSPLAGVAGCLGAMVLFCSGCLGLAALLPGPSPDSLQSEAAPEPSAEELAAAEHKRQLEAEEALEKAMAESKERAVRNRARANDLVAVFNAVGVTGVSRVTVNEDKATLVVENSWHFMPYQLRYQAAQNLHTAWVMVNKGKSADASRIEIVDTNGNRVGGSRALAGSLIWVQK